MGRETILILDRDNHVAWTLKTLLETEEYLAVVADRIEKAMKDFLEFKISGVIAEYMIDGMKTLGAIRRLKELFPETYVMMITDREIPDDEYEKVIDSGVDDVFLKPIPIKKILLHLRKGMRYRSLAVEKKRLERETGDLHPLEKVLAIPEPKGA